MNDHSRILLAIGGIAVGPALGAAGSYLLGNARAVARYAAVERRRRADLGQYAAALLALAGFLAAAGGVGLLVAQLVPATGPVRIVAGAVAGVLVFAAVGIGFSRLADNAEDARVRRMPPPPYVPTRRLPPALPVGHSAAPVSAPPLTAPIPAPPVPAPPLTAPPVPAPPLTAHPASAPPLTAHPASAPPLSGGPRPIVPPPAAPAAAAQAPAGAAVPVPVPVPAPAQAPAAAPAPLVQRPAMRAVPEALSSTVPSPVITAHVAGHPALEPADVGEPSAGAAVPAPRAAIPLPAAGGNSWFGRGLQPAPPEPTPADERSETPPPTQPTQQTEVVEEVERSADADATPEDTGDAPDDEFTDAGAAAWEVIDGPDALVGDVRPGWIYQDDEGRWYLGVGSESGALLRLPEFTLAPADEPRYPLVIAGAGEIAVVPLSEPDEQST